MDAERACSLLVGRCLGGMLAGQRTNELESSSAHWLRHSLLSNGLETSVGTDAGMHIIIINKKTNYNNNKKSMTKNNCVL